MLPETGPQRAMAVAERLRDQISKMPFSVEGELIPVSISLGVSCMVKGEKVTDESLVSQADEALYDAKQAGRNQTRVFPAIG